MDKRRRSVVEVHRTTVADWFEEYPEFEDGDEVWSLTWRDRILKWNEEHLRNGEDVVRSVADCANKPERLTMGVFFLAYPIAAFVLWNFIEKFEDLDQMLEGAKECPVDLERSPFGPENASVLPAEQPLEYLMRNQDARLGARLAVGEDPAQPNLPGRTYSNLEQKLSNIEGYYSEIRNAWLPWEAVCKDKRAGIAPPSWIFKRTEQETERRFKSLDRYIISMKEKLLETANEMVVFDMPAEKALQNRVFTFRVDERKGVHR